MDPQEQIILLPSPELCGVLNEEEQAKVKKALSDPTVQKYLRHLHFNALSDIAENEVVTEEQKQKLVMRFVLYKGIRHALLTLLKIGG